MLKRLFKLCFVGGIAATLVTVVHGQSPSAPTYATPSVSPYLNLGVTSTGMSNYPTLVRPMLDDQEALLKQSAEIQRLQRQLRGREVQKRSAAVNRDGKSEANGAPRFMNFSHYFAPGNREPEPRTAARTW
jgi:hypothetical protein